MRVLAGLLLLGCAATNAVAPAAAPPAPAAQAGSPTMIRYTVTLPERQAHHVHVRLVVKRDGDGLLSLGLPVWTPGSYLVREFARNVMELTASANGAPLAVARRDKNTWD